MATSDSLKQQTNQVRPPPLPAGAPEAKRARPDRTPENVGLFLGCFDPVTDTDLQRAKDAVEVLGLSKVLFLPIHSDSRNPCLTNVAVRNKLLLRAFKQDSYKHFGLADHSRFPNSAVGLTEAAEGRAGVFTVPPEQLEKAITNKHAKIISFFISAYDLLRFAPQLPLKRTLLVQGPGGNSLLVKAGDTQPDPYEWARFKIVEVPTVRRTLGRGELISSIPLVVAHEIIDAGLYRSRPRANHRLVVVVLVACPDQHLGMGLAAVLGAAHWNMTFWSPASPNPAQLRDHTLAVLSSTHGTLVIDAPDMYSVHKMECAWGVSVSALFMGDENNGCIRESAANLAEYGCTAEQIVVSWKEAPEELAAMLGDKGPHTPAPATCLAWTMSKGLESRCCLQADECCPASMIFSPHHARTNDSHNAERARAHACWMRMRGVGCIWLKDVFSMCPQCHGHTPDCTGLRVVCPPCLQDVCMCEGANTRTLANPTMSTDKLSEVAANLKYAIERERSRVSGPLLLHWGSYQPSAVQQLIDLATTALGQPPSTVLVMGEWKQQLGDSDATARILSVGMSLYVQASGRVDSLLPEVKTSGLLTTTTVPILALPPTHPACAVMSLAAHMAPGEVSANLHTYQIGDAGAMGLAPEMFEENGFDDAMQGVLDGMGVVLGKGLCPVCRPTRQVSNVHQAEWLVRGGLEMTLQPQGFYEGLLVHTVTGLMQLFTWPAPDTQRHPAPMKQTYMYDITQDGLEGIPPGSVLVCSVGPAASTLSQQPFYALLLHDVLAWARKTVHARPASARRRILMRLGGSKGMAVWGPKAETSLWHMAPDAATDTAAPPCIRVALQPTSPVCIANLRKLLYQPTMTNATIKFLPPGAYPLGPSQEGFVYTCTRGAAKSVHGYSSSKSSRAYCGACRFGAVLWRGSTDTDDSGYWCAACYMIASLTPAGQASMMDAVGRAQVFDGKQRALAVGTPNRPIAMHVLVKVVGDLAMRPATPPAVHAPPTPPPPTLAELHAACKGGLLRIRTDAPTGLVVFDCAAPAYPTGHIPYIVAASRGLVYDPATARVVARAPIPVPYPAPLAGQLCSDPVRFAAASTGPVVVVFMHGASMAVIPATPMDMPCFAATARVLQQGGHAARLAVGWTYVVEVVPADGSWEATAPRLPAGGYGRGQKLLRAAVGPDGIEVDGGGLAELARAIGLAWVAWTTAPSGVVARQAEGALRGWEVVGPGLCCPLVLENGPWQEATSRLADVCPAGIMGLLCGDRRQLVDEWVGTLPAAYQEEAQSLLHCAALLYEALATPATTRPQRKSKKTIKPPHCGWKTTPGVWCQNINPPQRPLTTRQAQRLNLVCQLEPILLGAHSYEPTPAFTGLAAAGWLPRVSVPNGCLGRLPTEILAQIFTYVPLGDFLDLRLVCVYWLHIIDTSSLLQRRRTRAIGLLRPDSEHTSESEEESDGSVFYDSDGNLVVIGHSDDEYFW